MLVWSHAQVDADGWLSLSHMGPEPPWEIDAPEQVYLWNANGQANRRPLDNVDLTDPDSLLGVVRHVGGFGPVMRDVSEWYEIPLRQFATSVGLPAPAQLGKAGTGLHIAEVGYRLALLDRLGRVARAYRRGDYIAPEWASPGTAEDPEARAWEGWLYHMNAALRRWHVRAIVSGLSGEPYAEEAPPTLLEVGALQIMNDLAREADFHVCANETCGRMFSGQLGGGEAFSRRTGVRYCSVSCKNAQLQREHRRRAKARKEGGRK